MFGKYHSISSLIAAADSGQLRDHDQTEILALAETRLRDVDKRSLEQLSGRTASSDS